MKWKLLAIILVLSVSFIAADKSYGCGNQSPVADLTADPAYAAVDANIVFDGTGSYDSDGDIVKYEWDFDGDLIYDYNETYGSATDGAFDGNTVNSYSSLGSYTVTLRVRDNYGTYDTDTYIVTVYSIIYVDPNAGGSNNGTDWDNAYNYLQDALDATITDSNVGEIWVADGIYKPDEENIGSDHDANDANETFQLEDIMIYGGFGGYNDGNETSLSQRDFVNNQTILSGDIGIENDVNDNCYHVVTAANDVTLDGFIITDGYAAGSDANGNGGGMYNYQVNPTIANCTFTENTALYYGGGMYNYECSPTLTNCTFFDNDADDGGGVYNNITNILLTNCVFAQNSAEGDGGAIYDSNSSLSLTNCTISKNDANNGGGIYNKDSSTQINNSILWGNIATDSGVSIYNYGLDEPNDSNLVGWWEFEEGSGAIASDSSGNDANGTLNGDPNWVTGKIGSYALEFVGVDASISIPINCHNGEETMSFWIKTTSTNASYFRYSSSPDKYLVLFNYPSASGNGGIYAFIENSGASDRLDGYASTNVNNGLWNHVVVITKLATNEIEIYVNGVNRTITYLHQNSPSYPLSFASTHLFSSMYHLDGIADDIRIYDRVLSAQEVRALSNCIRYSDVEGCGGSSSWDPNFGSDGGGNIDSDPCFIDVNDPDGPDDIWMTIDDGLRIDTTSPCADTADGDIAPSTGILGLERFDINKVSNTGTGDPNYADMGAYEWQTILYVDVNVSAGGDGLSWATAFDTIQEGIDAAVDGDTVIVAEGMYYETINFGDKSITVRSTDPNDPDVVAETITDANSDANNVVVFNSGEDENSILNGFTITGGNYGIYCASSSPAITNCTIRENNSNGIYIFSGSPVITGCDITQNLSHGIYIHGSSCLPQIINCTISNNQLSGLYSNYGKPIISGSTINNNNEYGIFCLSDASSVVLTNCTIAKNTYYGVRLHPNSYNSSTITNCTIFGNQSFYGVIGNSNDRVTNSILWDNGTEIDGCTATYCCTEDDHSGLGNFKADPCFVDTDSNDFRLDGNSICIDAGEPWADYSQEPSPNGGRINLGRYGNTSQATVTTDADNDGISDAWERYYWPDDDPNQHDPNENLDGDKFSNWSEYLFGYDANNDDSGEPIVIPCTTVSVSQFNPTEGETITITYWLNMDANVGVSFTNTNTSEVVRVLEETVSAGLNGEVWDGNDSNGLIAEDGFYDISIDANDGDGNSTSANPGTVELYYVHDINNLYCNPYRIIPMNNEVTKITYDLTTNANMAVNIYDPCGVLFATLVDDQLQTQGSQEIVWYGRDKDPNDPDSRYISIEGGYLVRVKFMGMREKEEDTVTAYK